MFKFAQIFFVAMVYLSAMAFAGEFAHYSGGGGGYGGGGYGGGGGGGGYGGGHGHATSYQNYVLHSYHPVPVYYHSHGHH